ncbi:MAG: Unknown protein [uncultured Campylobacterales bacterium]|uniref:Peptidase M30 n=1 Tax=uncultured Campylobacterales bacterium TaxID=352960 RepID=A0A6S6S7Q9_9BACT|nr:MAG: Unknown protein [uncultured Campylobacterales bacterium]
MTINKKYFLILLILITLISCSLNESETEGYLSGQKEIFYLNSDQSSSLTAILAKSTTIDLPTSKLNKSESEINHTLSETFGIYEIDDNSTDVNYSIDLGSENKNVYFIYTNKDTISTLPTSTSNAKQTFKQESLTNIKTLSNNFQAKHFESNFTRPKLTKSTKMFKNNNELVDNNQFKLNIWVDENAYGAECNDGKCITEEIIEFFSNVFLKDGNNNDIYDYVTNIYGEEWGTHSYIDLIEDTNTIDILLFDIDNDGTPSQTGGVLGYYFSKDNFTRDAVSGSNEKIMFYIDSYLLANSSNSDGVDDGVWEESDFFPQVMVSTLAHEFQHMIHFYQKNVARGITTRTDTWINEMMSEMTEDLVAFNINNPGPRNILGDGSAGNSDNIDGRIPVFNKFSQDSLTVWGNSYIDYSTVYSFGSFLLRNYGGASLLHTMMQNNLTDEQIVTASLGNSKTLEQLIQDWQTSVVLSKHTNAPSGYIYNTGDWINSTYNGVTYKLGSINFFNYNPTLNLNQTHTTQIHSSTIVQVANDKNGTFETNITKDANTMIKVVVEPVIEDNI